MLGFIFFQFLKGATMDYFGLYRVAKAARTGIKAAKMANSVKPLFKVIAAPVGAMFVSGACEEILDETLDKLLQESENGGNK